jgi:hypothetical protein
MKDNLAKQGSQADDPQARDADDAINARLADHIRANAIRVDISAKRLKSRGFFREAVALFGVIGLMVVSYVYVRLIGEEA